MKFCYQKENVANSHITTTTTTTATATATATPTTTAIVISKLVFEVKQLRVEQLQTMLKSNKNNNF